MAIGDQHVLCGYTVILMKQIPIAAAKKRRLG